VTTRTVVAGTGAIGAALPGRGIIAKAAGTMADDRLADPLRARLTGRTWCTSFVTLGELTK
jgi:hypothetical protein